MREVNLPHFQIQLHTKSPLSPSFSAMNMDSFDFDALDSATREQTLEFLNNYDPTVAAEPAPEGFGTFDELMGD